MSAAHASLREIAVVGAGAAGLTAALRAAESGARVTLLNAHPKIGLKILMSGGTRCNVTHREVGERDFHGGSRMFVRNVLRAFTPAQTHAWMESLGVALKLEETGKYFPVSDDARTVLEALLRAVARAGVEVVAGARVVRLERASELETAPRFRLGIQDVRDSAAFGSGVVQAYGARQFDLPAGEPDRWIAADAVVLATGGLSFPRTGSDGTGYALAQSLGHTLEPTFPALTPLTADDPLCRLAQGVAVEAELTLEVRASGETRRFASRGSLLFTHFGYSGPAALDFSRHWLSAEQFGARNVHVSFFPGERHEQVAERLRAAAVSEPRVSVRRLLARSLPESLVDALLAEIGVDPATAIGQIARQDRMRLASYLVARPLPVNGTLGYEKAEVTAGGVRLSEVDAVTLESRVAPGLYLCGEVLDVEGRLGGFNFQWAWSSGTLAGRGAGRSPSGRRNHDQVAR